MIKIILIMLIMPFLCVAQTTNYGSNSGTSGNDNTFFGSYSGHITSGSYNVFTGMESGQSNTIGIGNVFIGRLSGQNNSTGNYNVSTGYKTLGGGSGSYNIYTGYRSGGGDASYNISTGYQSGGGETTGDFNVFTGYKAGAVNSTGVGNIFIGKESGLTNSSGSYNVFSGFRAGKHNTTGGSNVFVGYESGNTNTTGGYNVFIGRESGNANTIGYGNVYSGRQSGYNNTSGTYNVFIGYKSGYANITGSKNVFLGYKAGEAETGSNRLYIDNSNTNTPLIYGKFDTDQLGINTNTIPIGYTMAIKGKLITEEIKVQLYGTSGWPDYVFVNDYNLPSLKEVENHIKEKGHLKDIPSAKEVAENGILLGDMNAKLLQKIEELTLYTIEQEKKLQSQDRTNQELKERLLKLEQFLSTQQQTTNNKQ